MPWCWLREFEAATRSPRNGPALDGEKEGEGLLVTPDSLMVQKTFTSTSSALRGREPLTNL